MTQTFAFPGSDRELEVHFGPLVVARLDERLRLHDRDTLADQVARGFGKIVVEHDELEDLLAAAQGVRSAEVKDETARDDLTELRHVIARLLGWTATD